MKVNEPFYKTITFWLVAAFIIGFGVNEVLTTLNLNPLRGQAFMSIDRNMCTSFDGDTAFMRCMNNSSWLIGDFGENSGGGGSSYATPNSYPTPANPATTCPYGVDPASGRCNGFGGYPPDPIDPPGYDNPGDPCYYTGTCDGDGTGR